MSYDVLPTPTAFLAHALGCNLPLETVLRDYQAEWQRAASAAPRQRLLAGYRAGVVWRSLAQECLTPSYLLAYVTAFYDPGIMRSHMASLVAAHLLDKYAQPDVRDRFLPLLRRQTEDVWQATWEPDARSVNPRAKQADGRWLLTGDVTPGVNPGAELALVAARPEGQANFALFLVPRRAEDSLNPEAGVLTLREREGFLIGEPGDGLALHRELTYLTHAADSLASVALAQRALAGALDDRQNASREFDDRLAALRRAFALAWESAHLANLTSRELPGLYSDTHALFRLVTQLALRLTADVARESVQWAAGTGRETIEGDLAGMASNANVFEALDVLRRHNAHRHLFDTLRDFAAPDALVDMERRVEALLVLPDGERAASAETVLRVLAQFSASALEAKMAAARDLAG